MCAFWRKVSGFVREVLGPRDPVVEVIPGVQEVFVPGDSVVGVDRRLQELYDFEKEQLVKYEDFLSDFGGNGAQKRAVVSRAGRLLVLAGAGSGKTKVLTRRFVHVVKNLGVSVQSVLAVTFTKAAVLEMSERIGRELGLDVHVLKDRVRTFHSLALSILRKSENFGVVSQVEQRDLIMEVLCGLQSNKKVMESLFDYLRDELMDKVRNADVDRTPRIKDKFGGLGGRGVKTITDVIVRSKAERDVGNLLTSLGLSWEYEIAAGWADKNFHPDFLVDGRLYLELWCYDDKAKEFSGIDKKKYMRQRRWKEKQFVKHKKDLFSVEERETLDLVRLNARLKKELGKMLKMRLPRKDPFDLFSCSPHLKKANRCFVEEIMEVINLVKSRFLSVKDVESLVKDVEKEKVIQFYDVCLPVMRGYEKLLRRKGFGKKDFADLIKDAVLLLRKDKVLRESYQKKLKYVLVDEFQDVSFGEVELIKLLLGLDTKLFCVGDDWQSIYGWRGSEVTYILEFEKHFGYTEKITLPYNYRSVKNVVWASSHFIQRNERQLKKNIKCAEKNGYSNKKFLMMNAKDDFDAARFVMYKIKKMMREDPKLKNDDFLILCRNSGVKKPYYHEFRKGDFYIPIRTMHWSKGKESRFVFVLGLKGGVYGFPNVYLDKEIKRVIVDVPLQDKEDEERRLFYVAMTRAKEKLFFMSQKGNPSEYLEELPKECVDEYPKK
jgi:DNA helicase-4